MMQWEKSRKKQTRSFAWHTTNELLDGVWGIIELSFSFYSRVAGSVAVKNIVFLFRLSILQTKKSCSELTVTMANLLFYELIGNKISRRKSTDYESDRHLSFRSPFRTRWQKWNSFVFVCARRAIILLFLWIWMNANENMRLGNLHYLFCFSSGI